MAETSAASLQSQGPLAGVRVIELAHIMAGPACGRMLADLGADVIKVEKIPGGDDTRRFLPPDINGESAAFMMMNRNKRGVAVDLKSGEGRQILLRLVAEADILIENYRHDTMARLGLDYDRLKEINPGLVYCEISGYGRTGPYAERGGFDLIAQGEAGLMAVTGEGAGRPPIKTGPPVSDITAGILAALGAVAAYAHKLKTGEGQRVDTSLFEAAVTQTFWHSAIAFATGASPEPTGSAHVLNAPYQAFQTKDGWVNVGGANQRNWERLLAILGAEELGCDPRFLSNEDRMRNRPELEAALTPHFLRRTTADWVEALREAGVPAGPVLSITEMHVHPQAIARGLVADVEHPVAGKTKTIGAPIKFSKTPAPAPFGAPLFGQHTREVLAEIGMRPEEIDAAIASGAVVSHDRQGQAMNSQ